MAASYAYDTVYFKWITADVFVNAMGGWAYIKKLQRIHFEQEEASVEFFKTAQSEHIQKLSLIDNKTGQMNKRERLEIGADYYAMVYCSYIKYYRKKYLITQEQRSIFFANAMFVFFIQLILFLLFLITVSDSFKFEDGFFVMIAFDVSIARFCNVLLRTTVATTVLVHMYYMVQ